MERCRLFCFLIFLFSARKPGPDSSPQNVSEELQILADLVRTLAARHGVTDPTDIQVTSDAFHNAALAFKSSLPESADLIRFTKDLDSLLQNCLEEHSTAASGLAGAETRVEAMDHLASELFEVAERACISFRDLEEAVLFAFADIEVSISGVQLSGELTPEVLKLVNLLLLSAANDIYRRAVLKSGEGMLETLEIDPYLAERYLEEISEMESGLLAALSGLELALAHPIILTDFERLVQEQFNLEAFNNISIE